MIEKKLKYQDVIERYSNTARCPFENSIIAAGKGFHFIIDRIDDDRNFLPRYVKFERRLGPPPRVNSESDWLKCSSCALSMFNELEAARKRYVNIPEPQKSKLGYTHIAEGQIDDAGLMTKSNSEGHFELFEFEGIDLRSSFVVLEQL